MLQVLSSYLEIALYLYNSYVQLTCDFLFIIKGTAMEII